ncbi:ankyrin repeat-containing domain protein [Lactarius akahatsu]|uniref:Ankyrin repeat-containing domain protein n=1 Tax=Lactarius akahatsu TaxID=416441 RepID=A0AAD4L4Y3_9AGAM|nr:ankyrin repeat-containing domain protein [Lactarius akahatsu]
MTNEEALMANAEVLKVAHDINERVEEVEAGVRGVGENVQVVNERVQTIIDDGMEARMIIQTTSHNVDDLKRGELLERLRNWQSPSDPSTNHVIASASRQHEGTAEWFCKGNIFEKWKATGSLLWIHGKPGSGKSVLCSAIINDIETMNNAGLASMAYFYFDFRDIAKQTRRDLLRSLLIQLSDCSDRFCDILSQLYEACGKGTRQPSDSALMHYLKQMLTLPDHPPVYLIMDALDESPNTSGIPTAREQVLDVVKELVDLRLSSLRICATSRPEVDIRYAIEPLAFCSVSLHNESGQEKDIVEYIKFVVHSESPSNRTMKQWRDEDKDMVVQALSEQADGMFRWVFCQLETLRGCFPQDIPHVLSQLPETLDETYARVLKEIGKTNRIYAHRLLQCLTVARRPLRVEELAEILALDFSAKEEIPELKENWRWKDQQDAVLSTCSSLISVVSDRFGPVVQFSHFSVQEFLTSDRLASSSADISPFHILLEPAHTVIVKGCLGVLLQQRVGDAKAGHLSPLAGYAAMHWADHARFENAWTRVEDGIRRLFDRAKPHLKVWLWLNPRPSFSFFPNYDRNKDLGSPLYYASLCGLRDLAARLVAENPQWLTGLVGQTPSPLVAALRNEHFDIAELLYQHGIDMDIRAGDNQTLLHAASAGGYLDIAKWLFEHGVPSNSQQGNQETPLYPTEVNGHGGYGVTVDAADNADHTRLHWASRGGHADIARELLMRGVDVATKDRRYRTPLHLASLFGHAKTVRLLIEHGADVTLRDLEHKTPLHLASKFESPVIWPREPEELSPAPGIVRLLIDHGADVTALDMTLSTPLHLASSSRNLEIVRILIENGADVNAQNETHSTPLHSAASKARNPQILGLLIEHGADVTAQDWNHETPLHFVSSWYDSWSSDYSEITPKTKADALRLLIEHGANVTAQNKTHSTPLHEASSSGSAEAVRILIEHGADVTAQNKFHWTPLHMASSSVSAETVQLLIEHGAGVTAQDARHTMPLHLASSSGLTNAHETVRLLIEHGGDVNAQDEDHSTPLHMGAFSGSTETMRLLIEHGADVTAHDGDHRTPLHLAASRFSSGPESSEIVRLLVEHGADVTVLDGSRKTPLHLASSWRFRSVMVDPRLSKEKAEIVRRLIEYGVDVTAQDEDHSTPLHLASSWGNLDIMRVLIEHGAGVMAQDRRRKTPLHMASSWDDQHMSHWPNVKPDAVRLLIDHGADVMVQDENHSTPLHLAAFSGSTETVRLLIERGADVTAQDRVHRTPLHMASSWDDTTSAHRPLHDDEMFVEKFNEKGDTMRLLINHGANVAAQDDNNLTPLHLASSYGSAETMLLLIERGADVSAQDRNHRTPLHMASSWEDAHNLGKFRAKADAVRLLIDHGADVTARDDNHSMPLHLASSFGSVDTVQLLIEHGADVTAQDGNHRTPLHLASSREGRKWRHEQLIEVIPVMPINKADTVQLLIRHGADVMARDDTHSTPLHLASSMWSVETIELLIGHGADVNAQNGNLSTPLHLAASSRLAVEGNVVRSLLKHGANIDAKDAGGRTPVQIASSEGHFWIAKLLSDHCKASVPAELETAYFHIAFPFSVFLYLTYALFLFLF